MKYPVAQHLGQGRNSLKQSLCGYWLMLNFATKGQSYLVLHPHSWHNT